MATGMGFYTFSLVLQLYCCSSAFRHTLLLRILLLDKMLFLRSECFPCFVFLFLLLSYPFT